MENLTKKVLQFSGRGQITVPQNEITTHKRMAYNIINGGLVGHIATDVYQNLNTNNSMLFILGVKQIYKDSLGATDIPFSDGLNVQFLEEGEEYVKTDMYRTKANLVPKRLIYVETYTREYLESADSQDIILSDAIFGIENEAAKQILNKITVNPTTGLTTTSYVDFIKSLNNNYITDNVAIVQNTNDYLANVSTLVADNKITPISHLQSRFLGTKLLGCDLVSGGVTAIADFTQTFVVWFGDLNIIVDYVTLANDGLVKVMFIQKANVGVNPYTANSFAV